MSDAPESSHDLLVVQAITAEVAKAKGGILLLEFVTLRQQHDQVPKKILSPADLGIIVSRGASVNSKRFCPSWNERNLLTQTSTRHAASIEMSAKAQHAFARCGLEACRIVSSCTASTIRANKDLVNVETG